MIVHAICKSDQLIVSLEHAKLEALIYDEVAATTRDKGKAVARSGQNQVARCGILACVGTADQQLSKRYICRCGKGPDEFLLKI